MKVVELTDLQKRALAKLTDEFKSAYKLEENISTLNALVMRGLAERHYTNIVGFYPRNGTEYRLAAQKDRNT